MDTRHALAAERTVAVWHVEIAVAALLALAGVAVMADSVRVGIGWGIEGPQAGFFPFYVGLILLGSAIATLVRNLVPTLKDRENFVDRTSLRRVLSVLLPIIVYVAVVPWTGLYLASALLIMFFMRAHGRFRLVTCLGIAVALMVGLFALFELWFLVPLPKGPIETALGY